MCQYESKHSTRRYLDMAINPMEMMKLKERMDIFMNQHPRVMPFFQALGGKVTEGSVIEMKVTQPDGTELVSNIRVTADDLETVRLLMGPKM